MRNRYAISGTVVTIWVPLHGSDQELPVLVDADDLPRLFSHRRDAKWRAWHRHRGRGYRISMGSKLLWRVLLNAPQDWEVDHINHNTLDNRRSNLRLVTRRENAQNLSATARSRSGIRNVTWRADMRAWVVQISTNGQNHYLGHYDTLDEAIAIAEQARAALFPGSRERLELGSLPMPSARKHLPTHRNSHTALPHVHWLPSAQRWAVDFRFPNGRHFARQLDDLPAAIFLSEAIQELLSAIDAQAPLDGQR
jgi:hypothetical protein